MADLNLAFTTWKEQNDNNNFMNNLLSTIPRDNEHKPSNTSINNKFMYLSDTEQRVKVTNPKYDKIIRGDRLIHGYICAECKGCMGYHSSIQHKYPHTFIRGEYRKLLPHEVGPFSNGQPLMN